jgi:hypothetical protein
MIETCSFGSMIIDGRTYTSDLLIFPDGRVTDSWWRAQGHRFTCADLEGLVAARPELIVAGTGIYGRAKVDSDLSDHLASLEIELVAAWTKKACRFYNDALQAGRKVAACFHVTC